MLPGPWETNKLHGNRLPSGMLVASGLYLYSNFSQTLCGHFGMGTDHVSIVICMHVCSLYLHVIEI